MALPRRHFLRNMGIMASGFLLSKLPASGIGGFQSAPHNIPVSKNLDPRWVRSLYQRGKATTYTKSRDELKYIGMPVGGIGCGTLYLGGDGRLWLWDIFNENQEGVDPRQIPWPDALHEGAKVRSRDGANYIAPTVASSKFILDQGFSVEVLVNGVATVKQLRAEDWKEVTFEATYPVATVTYADPSFPVAVEMKAYSPFIPLDADNSGLPATVFSFSVRNVSGAALEVKILGWLENGVRKFTDSGDFRRNEIVRNSVSSGNGYLQQKEWDTAITAIHSSYTVPSADRDAGTMCFAVLDAAAVAVNDFRHASSTVAYSHETATRAQLTGALHVYRNIAPKASATTTFIIAWHFKNAGTLEKLVTDATSGNYYAATFKDALSVAEYIAKHFNYLSSKTLAWHRTWYDSTLPWWFMERTFVNISCLATTTAHRFATGRFWAWEGVGACEGTCTHVWQYAQAMGRIFPSIEKDLRERVDLGVGFVPETGMIWFRAENAKHPAIDGQAGTVLRFYREHTMSADSSFLKRNWASIKKAITFIFNQDKNGDGMEDTPLENTLDAVWDGEIAWIVGLCIAAVRAGEVMALEMNDAAFAALCAKYVALGRGNMESRLFNGKYFIHRPDAVLGRQKLGSYNTSHIDQVYGQAWAHQVGLGRVLDKSQTISALKALWKYNFTPDVGPYIKTHKGGRPYALAGEGGMIMNTNPANEPKPYGESVTWQLGYFHECMSGFEHQVAAHMMAEGMIQEALVLTRAVHDRYHAAKRNPFNEIECSDHYARAMASYGTFITACGFEYHGPSGFISFAPRISASDFKAPFTAAEGWGTYSQKSSAVSLASELSVGYGHLDLQRIALAVGFAVRKVSVTLDGKAVAAAFSQKDGKIDIVFSERLRVEGVLGVKVS
ncbi:GH116 family glycosyl-hydrolase [Chitinophaga niabensis]|uniref:GH116 family glycosyl-hydrolase n=1 Tax=Chitinophaga niabensis TaxID=536979 RepID=UPI0031BB42E6